MDLYGEKSSSIIQKAWIIFCELALLTLAWYILFKKGGSPFLEYFGLSVLPGPLVPRMITFGFSIIIFFRITFMMLFLLKRKIPVEEAFSVPMAFSLYFVGFALFTFSRTIPFDFWDVVAIIVFLTGCFLNTFSELQRHFWKGDPQNKGKLYTKGLFSLSMHINYFGDFIWVCGFALVSRNVYAWLIPLFLFCFFVFYNIPKLDEHLKKKYKDDFKQYSSHTRKFIPFVY